MTDTASAPSSPSRATPGRVLAIAAALAALAQVALVVRSGVQPTDASAASVSAAVGLLNGRGMTVAISEANRAWDKPGPAGLNANMMHVYEPSAPRVPPYYPLPGVTLLMAASGWLTGQIRYQWLVLLQIAVHIALGIWFARELMKRDAWLGAISGAAWLLFAPFYRLNLPPTYDAWTGHASIAATTSALWYARRRSWGALAGLAAASAAGIWIREYFLVLPVLTLVALVFPVRAKWLHVGAYGASVALAVLGLASVRSARAGVSQPLSRDGVWHTFWAGVGQFDNPLGLKEDDRSVRDLAERLNGGKRFRGFFGQHHPDYERAIAIEGRKYMREHRGDLVRNALWRCAWLVSPGFAPSKTMGTMSAKGRLLMAGFGLVTTAIAVLAAVGWNAMRRKSIVDAVSLIVPWVALFPLTIYYVKAKVVILIYYAFLALATYGLLGMRGRGAAAQ